MIVMKIRSGLFVWCFALLALTGCTQTESNTGAPILLFNGKGTSPDDVAAIAKILRERGFEHDTANSRQLNAMSESQLLAYRLLIVPGGNYITMGKNLTPETTQRIQDAVQQGVNYLGICAGGLLAGKADSNSLNLTSGVKFGFYAVVNRGIHKAAVPIAFVESPVIEHYWEDGPQFTGWGLVVGKYPDGTPAIVEETFGKGWVILCGVHPEAPESWRRGMTFSSPASVANDYTGTLIDAAFHGTRLPHY
jgi:glutamine amidotransferase PdxT